MGEETSRRGSSSNRGSSPASSSPKNVVGSFDMGSTPEQWDNAIKIRDRIRCNQNLLMRCNHETGEEEMGYVEATTDNCRLNDAVLLPVLQLMSENGLQLPPIQGLIAGIETFYQLSKVVRSPDQVYQEAWAIRRLIGKTKKFTYRSFAPQDHIVQLPCKNTGDLMM